MIKYLCALPILFSGFAISDVKSNYTDNRGMFDVKDGVYECDSHIERSGDSGNIEGRVKVIIKKHANGNLVATIDLGEKASSPELPMATQSRSSVSYTIQVGEDEDGFGWSVKSVKDEGLGVLFISKDPSGTFVFVTERCKYDKK